MVLRVIRILKELTLGDIERAIGIDRALAYRIETGQRNPTSPKGKEMCEFLGVSPDWVASQSKAIADVEK